MTRTRQNQSCISAIYRMGANGALALGAMFVTAVIGAPAQTYTVLHTFKGSPTDGMDPDYGHLIGDSAGNLYGTTAWGGASDNGAVFKLDKTGETLLYSFAGGADGARPFAGLIRDSAGSFYGTTNIGGASGAGVVFKLDTTGTETVLYSFRGGTDGANPYGGLVRDAAGNLYGTTTSGGLANAGVVFKLDTNGKETLLHTFTGGADGAYPYAGLIRDAAGNLYGTTDEGGPADAGVVFKLDKTGETILHSFAGEADGAYPYAGLIRDSAGNLYGTTTSGGNPSRCSTGCGVVFKLDTTGAETVLYSFTGEADGSNPFAGLARDLAGNLYGTTNLGGASRSGVVFRLDTTGTETVLYSFSDGADGANPVAGLIQDAEGNLYGTTTFGGTGIGISGNGVVFRLQP